MRRLIAHTVLLLVVLAACGSPTEASATYHGGSCTYSGPTVFTVGEAVTFTLLNESESTDVGFGFVRFLEEATPEETFELGIFNAGGQFIYHVYVTTGEIGKEYEVIRTFSNAGLYGFNCFDESLGNGVTQVDFTTFLTLED